MNQPANTPAGGFTALMAPLPRRIANRSARGRKPSAT